MTLQFFFSFYKCVFVNEMKHWTSYIPLEWDWCVYPTMHYYWRKDGKKLSIHYCYLYVASVRGRILAQIMWLRMCLYDDVDDVNILPCMKRTALDPIIDWLSQNGYSCIIYCCSLLESFGIVNITTISFIYLAWMR